MKTISEQHIKDMQDFYDKMDVKHNKEIAACLKWCIANAKINFMVDKQNQSDAVEFAEWLVKTHVPVTENGRLKHWQKSYYAGNNTYAQTSELYEIFKKEKGI